MQQTERPGLFGVTSDADGALEPGEEQTIRATALMLGVPEPEVDELFALHRDERALHARKLALLCPHGHPWA